MNRITAVRGHVYPDALALLDNFLDTSYGNDITDSVSFSIGAHAYTVWIEHPDPSERHRDYGWNPARPVSAQNRPPARFVLCRLIDSDPAGTYRDGGAPTLADIVSEHQLADGEALIATDAPERLLGAIRALANGEAKLCLVVTLDLTGLTDAQIDALTGEVVVQAESSDDHPDVPVTVATKLIGPS